jgi:hypothetical protein
MSDADTASAVAAGGSPRVPSRALQSYGTIVVVGGGCYGSYYVRQLGRARAAGAITWRALVVVDRDPGCRVAADADRAVGALVRVAEWRDFFGEYLGALDMETRDAIVPSPLMPHLGFDWLGDRARARWPDRRVASQPIPDTVPVGVPWQRAAADGTRYVSYATWICPVNCIEPARCPHTGGPRDWTMPDAVRRLAGAERDAGRPLAGPVIFQCTHRAYGVGMIDCADFVRGDAVVRSAAADRPAAILVGTISHCHGALSVLSVA